MRRRYARLLPPLPEVQVKNSGRVRSVKRYLLLDQSSRSRHHTGGEELSLRERMAIVLSSTGTGPKKLLTALNTLARMVQEYLPQLKLTRWMEQAPIPPGSVLAQAQRALTGGFQLLYRLYAECPELCPIVLEGCKRLSDRFNALRYRRKNGTRSVHDRSVRKVQGRAEEREGGGDTVSPAGLGSELRH